MKKPFILQGKKMYTTFIRIVFLGVMFLSGQWEAAAQIGELKRKAKAGLEKIAAPSQPPSAVAEGKEVSTDKSPISKSSLADPYEEDPFPEAPKAMIFSTKPVLSNNEVSVKQFQGNDRIYARFVFSKTLRELTGLSGDNQVTVFMKQYPYNGTSTHLATYYVNDAILNQNYFDIEVLPDPATATWVTEYFPDRYGSRIGESKNGKYKLRFTLSAEYTPLAWGDVEYDMTSTNLQKLLADEKLAFENAANNYSKKRSLPKEFETSKGAFQSSELSVAAIRKIIHRDWGNVAEIKRLVIADESGPDWTVNKNAAGLPESKVTNKSILIAWKGKDGNCYFTTNGYLVMDYEGGGKFGPIRAGTSSSGIIKIGCANIR